MSASQEAVLRRRAVPAEAACHWGLRDTLLALLAVAYPFHYYVEAPGGQIDTSLGDVVVAIVVIGFCLSLLWDRIAFPRYLGPTAVFMLVAVASLAYPIGAPDAAPAFFSPLAGILEVVKVAGSAAWMVATYVLLRRAAIRGLRIFAAGSIMVAAAFALITIREGLTQQGVRPMGPFENENLYANYLMLNVFLATMLIRLRDIDGGQRGARVPIWLAIPILLVGILATGSRGALVGAALAFPLVLAWPRWSAWSAKRLFGTLLILVLAAYGVVAFWHANPFIADRLSTLLSGAGPNIEERAHLRDMALEAFFASPVLGIGFHQFPAYAEAVHGWKAQVAHNTYLMVAAELGVIGLMAFAWLFLSVIRDAMRMDQRLALAIGRPILAIVAATLIQGLVANVEHYRSLWIAMGLLAAIPTPPLSMSRDRQEACTLPPSPEHILSPLGEGGSSNA